MGQDLKPHERIILPLDVTEETARGLVTQLATSVGVFKVGYQLGYSMGWREACEMVVQAGGKIMVDAKLDDIPATVAAGVKSLVQLKPWSITLHASAGLEAMQRAVDEKGDTLLLAVTVLTSISPNMSQHIFGASPEEKVLQLAHDAVEAGVDGLVCSPKELSILEKDAKLAPLLRVIPGIRPEWASSNDQQRVLTPGEAIKAGADYLVIGRPITQPPEEVGSPIEAAKRIAEDIAQAVE